MFSADIPCSRRMEVEKETATNGGYLIIPQVFQMKQQNMLFVYALYNDTAFFFKSDICFVYRAGRSFFLIIASSHVAIFSMLGNF